MKNIGNLIKSQTFPHLSPEHGSLSHKQELQSLERCGKRLEKLKRPSRARNDHHRKHDTIEIRVKKVSDVVQNKLTYFQQRLLELLIQLNQAFDRTFMSHQTMAEKLGCNEKTIDRGIEELESLGLLKRIAQYKNKRRRSNETIIHPILTHPKLRALLHTVIKAYRYVIWYAPRFLSLWFLFGTPISAQVVNTTNTPSLQEENVPAENINIYINNLYVENDNQLSKNTRKDSNSRTSNITLIEDSSPSKCSDPIGCGKEAFVDKVDLDFSNSLNKSLNKSLNRDKRRESSADMSELLKTRVTDTLKLTAKGQFFMMRFCDGALAYGLECLSKWGLADTATNFKLFESACYKYSRDNQIAIKQEKYDSLLKDLGYVESQDLFKKMNLTEPLSRSRALEKSTHKSEPVPPRTIRSIQPTGEQRTIDLATVNPLFKDLVAQIAKKLGHEHVLSDSSQILKIDDDK